MNTRKTSDTVLLWAVITQGVYLSILIIMTVFYKPFMALGGATAEILEAGRFIPIVSLSTSAAMLLVLVGLYCWLRIAVKGEGLYWLPSILCFVLVSLAPLLGFVVRLLEMALYNGSLNQLRAYSTLTAAYQFAYPVWFASISLLTIGAALVLYEHKAETHGNSPRPVNILLLCGMASQGAYLVGVLIMTAFPPFFMRLWTRDPELLRTPIPIPVYSICVGAAAFGVAILAFCWISSAMKHQKQLLRFSVCIFVYVGISAVLTLLDPLQIHAAAPMGDYAVVAFSCLLNSIMLLGPLRYAGLILLSVGAALALRRELFLKQCDNYVELE